MVTLRAVAIFLFSGLVLRADETVEQTIRRLYAATFSALREAKSRADIVRLVDAIDAPEWVGNLPAGETMTRAEAVRQLEALIGIPPEKRPAVKMDIVYMKETGWCVLAVYWVYRQAGRQTIGSIARDTWVRSPPGWRRIRHEKLFPDRALAEDGKPVILPHE